MAPTFALGLGTLFQREYDQAGGGQQMPRLVTPRTSAGSIVVGDWLYLVGGSGGSGEHLGSVERARMNPAGCIERFAIVPGVTLANPRAGFGMARTASYLYVIGVGNATGTNLPIERAAVDADGNLGLFQAEGGPALQTPRNAFRTEVVGDHVYVFGGSNAAGAAVRSTESARIADDGVLGPFEAYAAADLVTARWGLGTAVVGEYLYVVGGFDGAMALSGAERARIDGSGQLGAFETVPGVTLSQARNKFGLVVVGNGLHVFGGVGGAWLNSGERAPINADGSLGDFQSATSMTAPRHDAAYALAGNHFYALGGDTPTVLASVERVSLNVSGNLGSFAEVTGAAAWSARYGFGSVVAGRYLYLYGGFDGSLRNDVWRAPIDAAGNLGTFTEVASAAAWSARNAFGSAVLGNFLYLYGGSDGSAKNDIWSAVLE